MSGSNFLNFIDCATLLITVFPGESVTLTCGSITKHFEPKDAYVVESYLMQYVAYIPGKDFGQWTVIVDDRNPARSKTLVINDYRQYGAAFLLPDDYISVEYLSSHGTEYINTGFVKVESFDVDFAYNQLYSGTNTYSVFGHRNTGSTHQIVHVGHYGGFIEARPPTTSTTAPAKIPIDLKKHSIQCGNHFNNTTIIDRIEALVWSGTQTINTGATYLFAEQSGGSLDFRGNVKIYHIKLWDTDGLLGRDMYPCIRKSDGAPGMYDIVNDVFYTNSGTGTFTTGPSFNKIKPSLLLYNYGNENIAITGGFEAKNSDSRYQTSGATVTKNKTDILLKNVSNASIAVTTKNKIDLTNYNTLEFVAYRASSAGDSAYYGLSSTGLPDANGAHSLAGNLAAASWSTDSSNPTIRTLDISSFAGEYYVWFGGLTSNGIYLQQIRLY